MVYVDPESETDLFITTEKKVWNLFIYLFIYLFTYFRKKNAKKQTYYLPGIQ